MHICAQLASQLYFASSILKFLACSSWDRIVRYSKNLKVVFVQKRLSIYSTYFYLLKHHFSLYPGDIPSVIFLLSFCVAGIFFSMPLSCFISLLIFFFSILPTLSFLSTQFFYFCIPFHFVIATHLRLPVHNCRKTIQYYQWKYQTIAISWNMRNLSISRILFTECL